MYDENEFERRVPEIATQAFRNAYEASLSAGTSVVVRRGEDIVRVWPDGAAEVLKPARPLVRIPPGLTLDLRRAPFDGRTESGC